MADGSAILTAPRPYRPALRYLGGKWRLAPWIIAHLPPHDIYVEPYGGGASVLLRKPVSPGEVYNDLDGDVVNLFACLRIPSLARALCEQVALTPYAREEFEGAYEPTEDRVERARRLVVRSFMGFGSNACNMARNTGFRGNATRLGSTPAVDWSRYPTALAVVAARIQQGVQIESRPALDLMRQRDGIGRLFYVDPPYLHETRSAKRVRGALHNSYQHEMTPADHAELLDVLVGMAGMVVLSGYPNAQYEAALAGWTRVERAAHADGARPRTEVLWINPAAAAALRGAAR